MGEEQWGKGQAQSQSAELNLAGAAAPAPLDIALSATSPPGASNYERGQLREEQRPTGEAAAELRVHNKAIAALRTASAPAPASPRPVSSPITSSSRLARRSATLRGASDGSDDDSASADSLSEGRTAASSVPQDSSAAPSSERQKGMPTFHWADHFLAAWCPSTSLGVTRECRFQCRHCPQLYGEDRAWQGWTSRSGKAAARAAMRWHVRRHVERGEHRLQERSSPDAALDMSAAHLLLGMSPATGGVDEMALDSRDEDRAAVPR